MDDDFGADDDFLAALAASETSGSRPRPAPTATAAPRVQQPTPQRIQQPKPQRLDRAPPTKSASADGSSKIVQPTPQALPQRSLGSSILVSPRQKGNPVLVNLRSLPWEYSDIPADFVLGLTTCALFLSLKYHRLHPEYIYTRVRNLQGKYNLRIVLAMVDIPNHEDALRELSKTSLINNVTLILCWSAAEAARYLELYKSYEHASFAGIKGQQATSYAEKLIEFVTVPRGVNKADAVSLVSAFGSLRNAINAEPEQVAIIGGWGEKKVKRWCEVVEEPFRVKKAAKRTLGREESSAAMEQAVPLSRVPLRDMHSYSRGSGDATPQPQSQEKQKQPAKGGHEPGQYHIWDPDEDEDEDEDAMIAAAIEESKKTAEAEQRVQLGASGSAQKSTEQLSDGIAAALAKLREKD